MPVLKRRDARYCSGPCRVATHRRPRGLGLEEAEVSGLTDVLDIDFVLWVIYDRPVACQLSSCPERSVEMCAGFAEGVGDAAPVRLTNLYCGPEHLVDAAGVAGAVQW